MRKPLAVSSVQDVDDSFLISRRGRFPVGAACLLSWLQEQVLNVEHTNASGSHRLLAAWDCWAATFYGALSS